MTDYKVKHKSRKRIKSARWLIFWVVAAQLAAEVAMQAAVSFMSNPPHEYIQIGIVELFALGVPILLYGKSVWSREDGDAKKELRLRGGKLRYFVLAAVLGISGQLVMMLLNIPANILIQKVMNREVTDAIPVALSGRELFMGAAAVVLLPAVLEEFWMRGLVFSAYNKCSTTAAVIFTTLVFALIHMRPSELLGFVLMGLTAAYVLLKTNSLYAAMTYHAFSNLTALVFGFVLSELLPYIWFILGAGAIIYIAALVVLYATGERVHRVKAFKAAETVCRSIFSLPILLSIAAVAVKYLLIKSV